MATVRSSYGFLELVALTFGLSACGGGDAVTSAGPVTAVSDTGALRVSFWPRPDPPVRGTNEVELTITSTTGVADDGRTVTVVPWMVAHGHGTSVKPVVEAEGDGKYLARNVLFFMAGRWELRATITASAGTMEDHAVATFDIP